jgi:tRNA/rRNA methyltransferase
MNNPAWILARTSHPGNIGSAARAIKTMGFSTLLLADPQISNPQSAAEAIALASGADDVLANSQVFPSLGAACAQFQWVFGLTSRDREFGPPAISLDEAARLLVAAKQSGQQVAFLFGTERTGLENEDFDHCTHRVWIDANPEYASLNLAQAVMVCAYEARKALQPSSNPNNSSAQPDRASQEAINAAMDHWREGLEAIGYLDPAHPKKLMPRLRALFDRAGLQTEEIDLIRGIAKQMLLKK